MIKINNILKLKYVKSIWNVVWCTIKLYNVIDFILHKDLKLDLNAWMRTFAFLHVGVAARALACACARVASLIQHATRRHISSEACLHQIFRHYFIKSTIFGKNVIEHKTCVLIFSTTFIWNISHSKMNSRRYCHKCENVFMWSTRYFWRILVKLKSSRNIFYKV